MRYGKSHEDQNRRHLVEERPLIRGRKNPDRDCGQEDDGQREDVQKIVIGRRSKILSATRLPSWEKETPKSSRAIRLTQVQYCT